MGKLDTFILTFRSYKETPISADEMISQFLSVKDFDVIRYNYYIVQDFKEEENRLVNYILIPLDKKELEKLAENFKMLDGGHIVLFKGTPYLIIELEDENPLIRFLKEVEPKIKEYYEASNREVFYITISDDGNIYINKDDGQVEVAFIAIGKNDRVAELILYSDMFEMARVWFIINDFIIYEKHGKSIATRFKSIHIPKMFDKNEIVIEYSLGNISNMLVREVLEHRFELYEKRIKKKSRENIDNVMRVWKELIQKYRLDVGVYDEVKQLLDRKALSIHFIEKPDEKMYMRIVTQHGEIYAENIIPEFVVEKVLKEHYIKILFLGISIIKKRFKERLERLEEKKAEKKKKGEGFLSSLFKKDEKKQKKYEEVQKAKLKKVSNEVQTEDVEEEDVEKIIEDYVQTYAENSDEDEDEIVVSII